MKIKRVYPSQTAEEKLQVKYSNLKKKNQINFLEMVTRGKDLEKFRKILNLNKKRIPLDVFTKLYDIVHSYILRCTESDRKKFHE